MSADKNTLFVRVTSDETIKNSEKIILNSPKANEDHSDKTCQTKENGVCALLKEHLTNEMFSSILLVFNTPRILLKLFLVIFNILAVGLASYTTIELILSYLEFGVTSTTRGVYETPAVFPKVTICNVNPFTSKYAYEFFRNTGRPRI